MESESWIFLRGLSRGQGHWGLFPQLFLERFPKAEIEFLDLPGCGTRNQEKSCLSMEQNLEEVRKSSQWVKEGKRFSVLAISLGGMVAAKWQDLYPDEVSRCFLINTSFEKMLPWKRFNPLQIKSLIRILRATHAREFEEAVTLMVCSHEGNRLKNLPALIDFSKKYPVNKFNMIRQIYAAARVRFPGRLKRPVFLLASDGDRLVSRDCTLALAAHWGAPASFHPWAGHDLPIDDPLWILNEIEKSS